MAQTIVSPVEQDEAQRQERIRRNQAVIELLRSWREDDDEQEQRETGEYLQRVLAEDHIQIGHAADDRDA